MLLPGSPHVSQHLKDVAVASPQHRDPVPSLTALDRRRFCLRRSEASGPEHGLITGRGCQWSCICEDQGLGLGGGIGRAAQETHSFIDHVA